MAAWAVLHYMQGWYLEFQKFQTILVKFNKMMIAFKEIIVMGDYSWLECDVASIHSKGANSGF